MAQGRVEADVQSQVLWPPDMPDDMLDDAIDFVERVCAGYNYDYKDKGDLVAQRSKL